jgi:hypothetical protein
MDESVFYTELRRLFPEVLEDVDDGISTGLLHLEMAELARLARRAISTDDRDTLLRCFAFAARALETGTPSIKNAVAVSFLENTLLEASTEADRKAEALLPAVLRGELKELREYWAELARRSGPSTKGTPGPRRKERPPNKRMQLTRSAMANGRRGPRS